MAVDMENIVASTSKLELWLKVRNNESLTLTDVPELIRNRWNYFRDNWEFIKPRYVSAINNSDNKEKFRKEINDFSNFVVSQRNSKNKKNPFDSNNIIYRFYYIFNSTNIDSIGLTYEEIAIVNAKIAEVQRYNRIDFINIRNSISAERDAIADRVGLTDSDYNRVFSRSPQTARVDIKNKDINNMYELINTINFINFILSNYFSLDTAVVDPFALAKANANNPEIDIATYYSGTLTKLKYGETLQSFAKRTLGSSDKWIDIAIANGLKPPYIDEVGRKIFLISNASGNQLNIAGVQSGIPIIDLFYIGQTIELQSVTQTFSEQRVISSLKQIPVSDEIVIEVSGKKDLERYKISENAHIRVYKPNTANSSVMLLVPSTETVSGDIKKETPWFLKSRDDTEKRQKIDLNINDDGDLNFNSNSDLQLVYGIENSIQSVKMKLAVERGELKRHDDYGLVNVLGSNNIDRDYIRNALIQSITANIAADARFSGLESLQVAYVNEINSSKISAFSINMIVKLAGTDQNIPISFSINV